MIIKGKSNMETPKLLATIQEGIKVTINRNIIEKSRWYSKKIRSCGTLLLEHP